MLKTRMYVGKTEEIMYSVVVDQVGEVIQNQIK